MSRFKKPLLFTLSFLPVAVAGGYLSILTSVSSMEPSMLEAAIAQVGGRELLIVVSTIQPVVLALLCAFFGYILSEKTGLMRPFRFGKTALCKTLLVSLLGGAFLSLDAWTFARWIPGLDYEAAGAFDAVTWIASVLYGGVVEEVMMRLFLMSLLVFLGWKLFFKTRESAPAGILIGANVIAAAVFAAGHLPATLQTFGALTPMLLVRCFLLNGAFGVVFGRLYRKHGIQYAMLAHMLLHIVSRTIWLIAF